MRRLLAAACVAASLVALALLCPPLAAQQGPEDRNVLLASDFETESQGLPSGWHPAPAITDPGSAAWARGEGLRGTRCLRLDVAVSYSAWQSNAISVRAGDACEFSAQIKGDVEGWAALALAFYTADGEPVAWTEGRVMPTKEWAARTVSGQAPPPASKVTALFYAVGEGTCWLDGAVVRAVSPPRANLRVSAPDTVAAGNILRVWAEVSGPRSSTPPTLIAELVQQREHQFLVVAHKAQELPSAPEHPRLNMSMAVPAHAEPGPALLQLRLEGAAWAPDSEFIRRLEIAPPAPRQRPGASPSEPPGPGKEARYLDYRGRSHSWTVNDAGALIWNGKPYIPAGCVFSPRFLTEYNPSRPLDNEALWLVCRRSLSLLKGSDIGQVLVRAARPLTDVPPPALQRLLTELDSEGMTYGIDLTDGPRALLEGYWVNRILDFGALPGAGAFNFRISQPAADLGGHLWLAQDDQGGVSAGRSTVQGAGRGAGQAAVTLEARGPVQLSLSPWILAPFPGGMDYWAAADEYPTRLRDYLSRLRLGPGLRFFLDPLGPGCGLAGPPVVPSSEVYRTAFARWLAARYQDAGTLCQQWAFEQEGPASFAEAAGLVPLRVLGERGYLYSPTAARLYAVQARHSTFWFDWLAFRDETVGAYLRGIAADLRSKANVPVVLRYAYTARRFYVDWGDGQQPDGLAMALNTPEDLAGRVEGAAAAGLSAAAARPMWVLAISDGTMPGPFPATQALVASLASAGAKGWFFQVPATGRRWPEYGDLARTGAGLEAVAPPRAGAGEQLARVRPQFGFWYPATPADLRAWDPEPGLIGLDGGWGDGMAILKNGRWLVPAFKPPPVEALSITSVSGPPASECYCLPLEQMVRSAARLTFIGQRTDLGVIPSLDRFFSPLPSGALGAAPQALVAPTAGTPQPEVLGSTPTGQVWHLRQGPLEIISVPVRDAFQAAEWLDVPPADNYYSPRHMAVLLFGGSAAD